MSENSSLVRVSSCPLCGKDSPRAISEIEDYLLGMPGTFTLRKCPECGMVFIDPRPTEQEIGQYYPSSYDEYQDRAITKLARSDYLQGKPGGPSGPIESLQAFVGGNISYQMIPRSNRPGTILDVGCANGLLLDKMKLLGWKTVGFEMSEAAAAVARRKGHDVTIGLIDGGLPYPDASFDCVYMWHVMEHTYHPRKAFGEIFRVLKPGGQLVMAVPNYGSLQARMFGRYWSKMEPPRHLQQFTKATMVSFLEREKFSAIRVTTRTGAASWFRCVRCFINASFGTKWYSDPAWILALMEIPVFVTGLFGYFGVGSDLRVTCRKPAADGAVSVE